MATSLESDLDAIASSPFAGWKYANAMTAVATTIETLTGESGFLANSAFVEAHDHWQDGDTWVGPDGGGSAALRRLVLGAVQRQFTPVDVIGEVLENVANGVLQREADIQIVPATLPADGKVSDVQQAAIDALRADLSAWWDKRRLWEQAKTAVRRSRWAGYGTLRAWITPDTLVTSGEGDDAVTTLPTGLSFAEALDRVQLMAPEPDVALVYTDPDTQQQCAIFCYTEMIDGTEKGAAEVWFVDGEEAVLMILRDGAETAAESHRVALGGRLPIAQMEADVLITEPVRRQQNRLNFFESLLTRVGETAGFPERYTLNAAPHGVWLETPPADGPALEVREIEGTTWYLHRAVRTIGAAITTDLRGIMTTDEATGKERVATPGVEFKEPTDPEYAIKACDHARATILRECRQGHLANTSQAETSGDAYEQARSAFESDLMATKGPLESMLREILCVAIAYAEAMSGKTEGGSRLAQYRIGVTCHVNAGPISSEKRKAILQEYKDGVISKQTAMAMLGVEDTAAEMAALENDPLSKFTLLVKQGEAVRAWVDAGAPLDVAAELCGIAPVLARRLVEPRQPDPIVEQ